MVLLESLKVPLGTAATDFSLVGIDGGTHSLGDYKNSEMKEGREELMKVG
jgi:hypothetical protein